MSTPKAKSLALLVPAGAMLVLSAMLATPGLSGMAPAYACNTPPCNDTCDTDKTCDDKCKGNGDKNCKDKDKDKCKDKDKDKCKDKDGDNNKKVTICHVPPGNPNNAHTITVGQSALKAHLDHGDEKGPCKDTKPPCPKPCDCTCKD